MAEIGAKKTVTTKAVAEKGRRARPKDAQDTESQAIHYARKFMEAQAAQSSLEGSERPINSPD